MTAAPTPVEPELRARLGLRIRLWIGALGGALAGLAGLAWVLWGYWPTAGADGGGLELRLGIVALASVFVGLLCAWWLDRGVVRRVRRLAASARTTETTPLHDPFTASGWGEMADLRNHVSALITRYRHAARAADQLQQLERQLESARDMVQRWIETEQWMELPPAAGPLMGLSEALNRGFGRLTEVSDQNQEAARQVQAGIVAATAEARETAEQSERGFVEVTSLLTTVRELERLGGELQQALGARRAAVREPGEGRDWLEPASEAIRELVGAASSSMDELAAGLAHVQELSEHVHVLGNRATLIALNAMLAARRGEPESAAAPADELKQLAREARLATDRVQQLARDIEAQIQAAGDRMKGVRERVNERLSKLEPPPPAAEPELGPDTVRALERVREMITDAARKAERLSVAGERASRAADRLVRRLDEDLRDIEGLVVRLAPPAAHEAHAARREAQPRRFDVIGPERRGETAPRDDRGPRAEERP